MNKRLLKHFLKMVIAEVHDARVPNQLLSDDSKDVESDTENNDENDVNEFSGVGGIMGYSAPLGMNPDALGRKKNKRTKK